MNDKQATSLTRKGFISMAVASHRGETSPKPVMRRLLPTLAAIAIVLLAGAGALLSQQHRMGLARNIAAGISEIKHELRIVLDQQTNGMAATLQLIIIDATVRKALREGDADYLLAAWQPVFKTLHSENFLTHFYFFDKNRVCLLRVHMPEKRGDRIERFTALEAERTGKTTSGLELGPLGTFTLRVVQPVFEEGALVGYVEMGKEIEDVLQALSTRSNFQLAVVIRKANLNRLSWEEGMRMLGREDDWDRLPGNVVIYASQGHLSDAFAFFADHLPGDYHGEVDRKIAIDGKDWWVWAIPMPDVSGRMVGDMLIMRDISTENAAFVRLMVLGGAAGIVLLAVLLGFIYVLLSRTDADLRAQEAAMQESEESYRNQFYNNSVVMLLKDPEKGAIIDANTAALDFYGYSRERLLAMRMTDINTLPTSEVRKAMVSVPQGAGKQFEFQHRLADGSLRHVEVSTSSINFGGRIVLSSIIHDITKRKQAEEGLKYSLSLLSASLESTADGILIVDRQGKIAQWNEKFTELWKIPKEVLSSRDDKKAINYILTQLREPEQFADKVKALYQQPEQSSFDLIEFVDGRVFERYSQPQRIDDKIVGRVWSFRDITERKHAEEEKSKLEAQFLQAQKMESIGQLAGGIAHDFNNMLMVILGHAEMAMEKVDPVEQVFADLEEIRGAANRSADMTRQLLAFARKQTIVPKVIDLNETVEKMLKILRRLVGEDIDLVWMPGIELWKVKVDPAQIDQILANLCVNARDAVAGVGKITVETRNSSLEDEYCDSHAGLIPGEYVQIVVSDNGHGMDKEILDHVFEPFFTTKSVGKGTGLGLSTVYGAVKQNNGFIYAYSKP